MNHVRLSFVLSLVLGCVWPESPICAQTKEPTAQVIVAVAPAYPPVAVSANLSDDLIIEVEINKEGAVTSVHAVSGNKLLQLYSERAAKRWRFSETTSDTMPRRTRITLSRLPLVTRPQRTHGKAG